MNDATEPAVGCLAAQSLYGRGLRLVRPVAGIVSGFDFRETPDARSMDLDDGVLDLLALDGFFDRAILDLPLQADELALQERLGEGGEIAPDVDAVPFGAGFVLALIVLPALAGGDAEDGVVLLVLYGFDFCRVSLDSETPDSDVVCQGSAYQEPLPVPCRASCRFSTRLRKWSFNVLRLAPVARTMSAIVTRP